MRITPFFLAGAALALCLALPPVLAAQTSEPLPDISQLDECELIGFYTSAVHDLKKEGMDRSQIMRQVPKNHPHWEFIELAASTTDPKSIRTSQEVWEVAEARCRRTEKMERNPIFNPDIARQAPKN